ncbi:MULTISPECIES: SIMPL domain-containing protein [Sphingomonas]|uniref:SIMPL domain-containing protein n=1 Tax=Sphingomonas TaxID=13687 RepID=UPI000DEEE86D|nr:MULTISPECIES: SIMPL domain-containing protein [Sphingomonas]
MSARVWLLPLSLVTASPAAAQIVNAAPAELAANPVITLVISEQLRTAPDQATLTISTEGRAPKATDALAENRIKTEALLGAIRRAGIADKDVQTQGISLNADYVYENVGGVGRQRFNGYIASNSVRIKTRNLDRLTALLDTLTSAGATGISGPYFEIADPLPIRARARTQAMARGVAEATEYARSAGFAKVSLLTVQEGVSYRASEIVVTGSRLRAGAPPPPPPPAPERDSIAPGQIETGVTLTLQYRMER